jgi:hypothetical protein
MRQEQIKLSKFKTRIQSQDSNLKFLSSVYCGPITSINKFLEIMGVELDLAPKREYVSHDLFYRCANIQKLWGLANICLREPNISNQPSFQTGNFQDLA